MLLLRTAVRNQAMIETAGASSPHPAGRNPVHSIAEILSIMIFRWVSTTAYWMMP